LHFDKGVARTSSASVERHAAPACVPNGRRKKAKEWNDA
jgi:hypothetical protein